METAHRLRSRKNAKRLLTALARARNENLPSQTVDDLREIIALVEKEEAIEK